MLRLLRGMLLGTLALLGALVARDLGPACAATVSQFTVDRRVVEVRATPGQRVSDTVALRSIIIDDVAVLTEVVDVGTDASGDLVAVARGVGAPSAAAWVTTTPTGTFPLQGGASERIAIQVNVPKGTPGGGYYAAVTFVPSGQTVRPEQRITHVLLVRVDGPGLKAEARVARFSVRGLSVGGSMRVDATFSNPGNVHTIVRGAVKFTDQFGHSVGGVSINGLVVLPGMERSAPLVWKSAPLVARVRARLTVDLGDGQSAGASAVGFVVSWLVVGIVAGVVAALLLALALRRLLRRRRVRGTASEGPRVPPSDGDWESIPEWVKPSEPWDLTPADTPAVRVPFPDVPFPSTPAAPKAVPVAVQSAWPARPPASVPTRAPTGVPTRVPTGAPTSVPTRASKPAQPPATAGITPVSPRIFPPGMSVLPAADLTPAAGRRRAATALQMLSQDPGETTAMLDAALDLLRSVKSQPDVVAEVVAACAAIEDDAESGPHALALDAVDSPRAPEALLKAYGRAPEAIAERIRAALRLCDPADLRAHPELLKGLPPRRRAGLGLD